MTAALEALLRAGKRLGRGKKRPRASADTTSAGPQSDDSDDEVEGDRRQHGVDGRLGRAHAPVSRKREIEIVPTHNNHTTH